MTAQFTETISTLAAKANLDQLIEEDPAPATGAAAAAIDRCAIPDKYQHLNFTYITPNIIGECACRAAAWRRAGCSAAAVCV